MAIRKVHTDTAQIARKYAREELGIQEPKLRAPTKKERIDSTVKARLDVNQVRDTVVVQDKKGQEFLLMVDLDPKRSRDLNIESAILTGAGLVPIVGAPVVAAFAIKDLVKGGASIAKAKMSGNAPDPESRAIFRMGIKHLGLSGLSMATHGAAAWLHASAATLDVAEAAHGAAEIASHAHGAAGAATAAHSAHEAAELAHTAHEVVVGAEVAATGQDSVNTRGKPKHKGPAYVRPFKAIAAGLQGIAGVHGHHERSVDDARVVVVSMKKADGTIDRKPEIAPPKRAEGADQPTGPPPG